MFNTKPRQSTPFQRVYQHQMGWIHRSYVVEGVNGSTMVAMFVDCCVGSGGYFLHYSYYRSSTEREFSIPTRFLQQLIAQPLLGSDRNKKLLPHRIPTVGILRKVPSTTNTAIPKHHHYDRAVCPSYGVRVMDLPDPMQVTSLEGVGQGRLGWV